MLHSIPGTLAVLGVISLTAGGCDALASRADIERLETKLLAQERRPPVSPERFELRELRNGPVITTGLLDKQTGRIWLLAAAKGSTSSVGEFEPVRINTFPPKAGRYAGLGPYVPPTSPTLSVELPNGWSAEDIKSVMPPCPANDPFGLSEAQPCAPLLSKKGEEK